MPNVYYEHIEKVTYRDGLPYYSGFLWEFLYDHGKSDTLPISEEEGLRLIETHDMVLFMFDLSYYESDRQRPKVPPFDRPDWQHLVYKAKASCLPKLIWESWNGDPKQINAAPDSPVALPESVYVFDESFSWFVAFTEENDGQDRICFCRKCT